MGSTHEFTIHVDNLWVESTNFLIHLAFMREFWNLNSWVGATNQPNEFVDPTHEFRYSCVQPMNPSTNFFFWNLNKIRGLNPWIQSTNSWIQIHLKFSTVEWIRGFNLWIHLKFSTVEWIHGLNPRIQKIVVPTHDFIVFKSTPHPLLFIKIFRNFLAFSP